MATPEALKKALELEEEGKRFYEEVASRTSHPLVKALFEALAKEELLHMKKIGEIYGKVKEGAGNRAITCSSSTPWNTFRTPRAGS